VPEYITQPVAQLAADFGYAFVGGPTVRAGVTAVLDQGNGSINGAEYVVMLRIDRTVEPDADWSWLRHP
jgi:hypothetical protein